MIGVSNSAAWTPRGGAWASRFHNIAKPLEPCELAIVEGSRELNISTFPVDNKGLGFFPTISLTR